MRIPVLTIAFLLILSISCTAGDVTGPKETTQSISNGQVGKRVASFRVDEANYVGALRHHRYMEDKTYRDECAIRSGAEATVSEITRTHGMRKSRHRKQARTWLQLIFAAIACNVKRFIRYGQNYAYLEAKFA